MRNQTTQGRGEGGGHGPRVLFEFRHDTGRGRAGRGRARRGYKGLKTLTAGCVDEHRV